MYFIWFDSIVILVLIVTAHAAIKNDNDTKFIKINIKDRKPK